MVRVNADSVVLTAAAAGQPTRRWTLTGHPLSVVRQAAAGLRVPGVLDVAAVPASAVLGTLPHVVCLDVDSTLIEQEVIELLASRVGCQEQVARITELAMTGRLDFTASLRERVGLLAGFPEQVLDQLQAQIQLTNGARELVRWLQERGHRVLLASGGFTRIIAAVADSLGVDAVVANTLQVHEGLLTGRVQGPIVDGLGKATALTEHAQRWNIPTERSVAIGDGANDIEMLAAAGVGVAFCAKPALREMADVVVDIRDLRQIIALLGPFPTPEADLPDPPGAA